MTSSTSSRKTSTRLVVQWGSYIPMCPDFEWWEVGQFTNEMGLDNIIGLSRMNLFTIFLYAGCFLAGTKRLYFKAWVYFKLYSYLTNVKTSNDNIAGNGRV